MNKAGFATVNPSTGEEIEVFSYFTPAQIEKVVARADKSFQSFRKLSVHKRAQLFTDLGHTLRKTRPNSRRSYQRRWERSSPRLRPRLKSARMKRIGTLSTDRKFWRTNPLPQGQSTRMSPICPLGQSSRSCRGVFRSGSSHVWPSRRCWQATSSW